MGDEQQQSGQSQRSQDAELGVPDLEVTEETSAEVTGGRVDISDISITKHVDKPST